MEADLGEAIFDAVTGPKPLFPVNERDQTPAAAPAVQAEEPLDAALLAARFKQGQKARKSVEAVLASLHRMGIVSTDDCCLTQGSAVSADNREYLGKAGNCRKFRALRAET